MEYKKRTALSSPYSKFVGDCCIIKKKKVSTLNHDSPSVYKPRHKQLCHTINCYI